jgi:hypothetical protein
MVTLRTLTIWHTKSDHDLEPRCSLSPLNDPVSAANIPPLAVPSITEGPALGS